MCIDSVAGAMAAETAGADRVELCADLFEGGITPSAGMIAAVCERVALPVMVMVRPRAGDFVYDATELEVMVRDIRQAAELGAAGVVFGLLTVDGQIDVPGCRRLLEVCRSLPVPETPSPGRLSASEPQSRLSSSEACAAPGDRRESFSVTFHRAFDLVDDPSEGLETLVHLGFDRVLTSGGAQRAPEATDRLASLVRQAANRMVVMPGAGVLPENVRALVDQTGCREIHLSATAWEESRWRGKRTVSFTSRQLPPEWSIRRTSAETIVAVRRALVG